MFFLSSGGRSGFLSERVWLVWFARAAATAASVCRADCLSLSALSSARAILTALAMMEVISSASCAMAVVGYSKCLDEVVGEGDGVLEREMERMRAAGVGGRRCPSDSVEAARDPLVTARRGKAAARRSASEA